MKNQRARLEDRDSVGRVPVTNCDKLEHEH